MADKLEYDIKRWDSVTCTDDDHPKPMIYIKPDIKLLDYFRENDNKIWVKIIGTDIEYDDIVYHGVVEKSSWRPNYTPNFFSASGLYVVTLDSYKWLGYPIENGKAIFQRGVVTEQQDISERSLEDTVQKDEPISEPCGSICKALCGLTGRNDCDSYCRNLCKNDLIIFSVFVLIILFIVYKFYIK